MSIFKKLFGVGETSESERESEFNARQQLDSAPIDEKFTHNFKKNGGKFLYCENLNELKTQFENILEENDWFEAEAMCLEPKLYSMLDDNNVSYANVAEPKFLLASCENLIADEGAILFSSNQIKQNKPSELPSNMVIIATTSQLLDSKTDSMCEIKKRYDRNYPTNITAIKYFEKAKEEDFLQYGSTPKNLYLLLLEDL